VQSLFVYLKAQIEVDPFVLVAVQLVQFVKLIVDFVGFAEI
jgi:hypothetical protein